MSKRVKLGSGLIVAFFIASSGVYGEYIKELTDISTQYENVNFNLILKAPEIDENYNSDFTPTVTEFLRDTEGGYQIVTSTSEIDPDKFESNQADVNYNRGLWVETDGVGTYFGENYANFTNSDSEDPSYGMLIITDGKRVYYNNKGNIDVTGKNNIGLVLNGGTAFHKVVNNYGNIKAENCAVEMRDSDEQLLLNNYGKIEGNIRIISEGANVELSNQGGYVKGDIFLYGDYSVFSSAFRNQLNGIVDGNIYVYGNGYLDNSLGTINGNIYVNNGGLSNFEGTINGKVFLFGDKSSTVNGPNAIIKSDGDYGVVILNGGDITNYGSIENTGNFGVIVINKGAAYNSATINNGDGSEYGNYGMIAIDGGEIINSGIIENSGDYGMAVINEGYAENNTHIQNNGKGGMIAYGAKSIARNTEGGYVANHSKYGMIALEGASIYNEGVIANSGDVGMYIDSESYGYNSGTINNSGVTGVFTNKFFLNTGTIEPVGGAYAVISGASRGRVIFINPNNSGDTHNPIPYEYASLLNADGMDVLQFGAQKVGADAVLNSDSYYYNYLLGSGWIGSTPTEVSTSAYKAIENTWTLNGNHIFLGGVSLADEHSELAQVIQTDKNVLDTNIVMGKGSTIKFIMGRNESNNLTSPMVLAKSYDTTNGTHTNIVLDESFITNDSRIVFNVGKVEENVGKWNIPDVATAIYTDEEGIDNNIVTKTTSTVGGWIPHHEIDSNGNLYLVYTRLDIDESIDTTTNPGTTDEEVSTPPTTDPTTGSETSDDTSTTDTPTTDPGTNKETGDTPTTDTSTTDSETTKDSSNANTKKVESVAYTPANPAPGGYGEAQSYPHTNLDIVNTRNIVDRGYLMAKRMMFDRPKVTEERIVYPGYTINEKGKETITVAPVEEIIRTEAIYGDHIFAELFGEWGNYTGSGARYSYQTAGVTVGNFHRFESNPDWMIGATYGYAHSKANFKNYKGSNEKIDTLGMNAYLTWSKNNWIVTGTVGYSWSEHDLKRKFADYDAPFILGLDGVDSVARQASKKFDSHEINVGFEVGYNYKLNSSFTLYPYVGFDYIFSTRDGYTENADGMAGINAMTGDLYTSKYTLQVNKNEYNTGVLKAGLITEWFYKKWCFALDVAYRYYTSDYDSITGTYVDASDRGEKVVFHSSKQDVGRNMGYITASVNYELNESWIVGTEFTGYYRDKQSGNLVGANLTYRF